jgi:hypothetical protein
MRTRCRTCFASPTGTPVRLSGSPDSGGCPTGCRGDSTPLGSPGNTPLGQTDGLVAQTRWGTPPEHVPDIRFATREPAAVIQTVVHCMLQNRFAGFRIRRVVGKHIGKATSRVRQSPDPAPPPASRSADSRIIAVCHRMSPTLFDL